MNEIAKRETSELSADTAQLITAAVREIVLPILEPITQLLNHNTQAMEQIAAAEQLASERIAALEKQIRLNTPMSAKQAAYINDAARTRAKELLDKRGYGDNRKAVNRLAGLIRKSVMARYGAGCMRDIPNCEYSAALQQAGMWNQMLLIQEVCRDAGADNT